jgi:hypothetical protein
LQKSLRIASLDLLRRRREVLSSVLISLSLVLRSNCVDISD